MSAEPQTEQPPAKRVPLFELAIAYRAALDRVDEAEGEVTDETGAMLDDLGLQLEQRCEVLAMVRRMLLAEADACDETGSAYIKLANQKRAKVDRIERRVKETLEHAGVERAIGATGGAALQLGPEAVELDDVELPDQYVRVRRSPDMAALRAALKAGATLAYARLVRRVHLRWK